MSHELLLLRHGEVQSHRGDVPVTAAGLETAAGVGRHLAARAGRSRIRVISGDTRRARDTAAAVASGAAGFGADVVDDGVAAALRNPDLYLAGVRVEMVSSAADFAAQVPGLSEADVAQADFFREWLSGPDRVGWWVAHPSPPGEAAADVVRRMDRFAGSLTDRTDEALVVGITHSPVLRALAVHVNGSDPGEPNWLAGIRAHIADDRSVTFSMLKGAP